MNSKFIRRLTVFLIILQLLAIGQVVVFAESSNINSDFENTHVNTGNNRIDIVSVARTQIGYREGDNNDTKYGTWYGLPNQPWCAMFVSWCARQADIPTDVLRNCALASPEPGYFSIPFYDGEEYIPQSGDLFFTKSFSHVGLVDYVDGDYFYTIEGNTNDSGSSMGIGVFTLRRKISDYLFGVPEYNFSSVEHDCNKDIFIITDEEHPHYSNYMCSTCGEIIKDTSIINYNDNCVLCNSDNLNLIGDVNGDYVVSIKDVTLIQKYLAGIEEILDVNLELADTDSDTEVSIKDATAIQKHLAGIETGYLIGTPKPNISEDTTENVKLTFVTESSEPQQI